MNRDAQEKSRQDFFHGAISSEICWLKSGFGLLRVRCFFALRFQLGELLRREDSLGLFQECFPAFLRAACLHAIGLPRFDFCLLIGREIQCCQINARH